MTTNSDEAPDGREEIKQHRERGGAADIDRSKSLDADDSDSPFGSAGAEVSETQQEKRDE